jgi:hypothetical protein
MSTAVIDKYMFWETNSSQVAGDGEYMSNWNIQQMPQLAGAVSLNLAGLPENKYGIPIGLSLSSSQQHGGEDSDMVAMHTGEEEIEYGNEQIYGPEDDPINIYDATTAPEDDSASVPVAPVVDAMLYDEMMKKVSPHANRRSKQTKRTGDKRQHKKTKKGGYAK